MLPPDTSSSLPWRVMVPLMQVYGCFPYKMSATSPAPIFSLPLCLWGVVIQLLMVIVYCAIYDRNYSQYTSDLGTDIHVHFGIIMVVFMCLAPIVMAVKSNMLATLLHDMSQIKGVSPLPSYRWYNKTRTLVLLFLVVSLTGFTVWFSCTRLGNTTFLEVVFFTPVCVVCSLSFLLPEELSSMVFDLISRRLMVATEAMVATVLTLLASDGSFKCESDTEAAMVALRDLDAVIREVEVMREKGTRCFFPVITMFLLMSVLLAITSPYAIKQGSFMGGTTIATLFMAYHIMACFSHLGQTFISQVSAAEGLLKDLKVKSQNLSFSLKVSQVMGSLLPLLTFDMCGWYTLSYSSLLGVSQVMGSLLPLLTFDMCGWYTLSYSSLLGLVNTILTYLVIVFQVGGVTVEKPQIPLNADSSTVL